MQVPDALKFRADCVDEHFLLEGACKHFFDLADFLRVAAKKSLTRGLVIHNSDTSAFRAVAGKKGTKSKSERREEKERRRERKEKKLRKLQLQKNVSSSTEESPKVGRRLFPEKNGKEAPI